LLLLRATRLQTISAFRRLGSSALTTVVHCEALAVAAQNANPLLSTTRDNLITTTLLQLSKLKQSSARDVMKHGPIQQPISRRQLESQEAALHQRAAEHHQAHDLHWVHH
jgi:formaldehyde-activating enzyme involved in methanogenesis